MANIDKIRINQITSSIETEFDISSHPFFMDINQGVLTPNQIGEIVTSVYFVICNWELHLQQLFYELENLEKLESTSFKTNIEIVIEKILVEKGYQEDTSSVRINLSHITSYINFLHILGSSLLLIPCETVKRFNETLAAHLERIHTADDADTISKIRMLSEHICVLIGIERFYRNVCKQFQQYLLNCPKSALTYSSVNRRPQFTSIFPHINAHHKKLDFAVTVADLGITEVNATNSLQWGFRLLWDLYNDIYSIWKRHNTYEIMSPLHSDIKESTVTKFNNDSFDFDLDKNLDEIIKTFDIPLETKPKSAAVTSPISTYDMIQEDIISAQIRELDTVYKNLYHRNKLTKPKRLEIYHRYS